MTEQSGIVHVHSRGMNVKGVYIAQFSRDVALTLDVVQVIPGIQITSLLFP